MNKNIRIYISGQMTGLTDFNYPAFMEAEKTLRKLGYKKIVNPARNKKQNSWEDYMKICIPQVCKCELVLLLDGWQNSRGAILEEFVANRLNIKVTDFDYFVKEQKESK